MPVVKTCACGASYTPRSWKRLHFVGVQAGVSAVPFDLELRDCTCGSTLGLKVPRAADRRAA